MKQKPSFSLKPSHWINTVYYLLSLLSLMYFPFFIIMGIYKYLEIEFWWYDFYEDEIVERKGVFNVTHRKISYLRIKDVALDEPLLYRIVGLAKYYISSSDPYMKTLILTAVPHNDELWKYLKKLVNNNVSKKNQIEVDLNYL